MRYVTAAVLVFVCLLSLGCKSGVDVTGKWKGSIDTSKLAANDPGAEMAKKMMGSISLDLKQDHTFNLTMMFPFEGTWSQSDSKISLKMTKAMGMDIEKLKQQPGANTSEMDKPLDLTISPDGKTLTGKDPSGKGQDMTFTRE